MEELSILLTPGLRDWQLGMACNSQVLLWRGQPRFHKVSSTVFVAACLTDFVVWNRKSQAMVGQSPVADQ